MQMHVRDLKEGRPVEIPCMHGMHGMGWQAGSWKGRHGNAVTPKQSPPNHPSSYTAQAGENREGDFLIRICQEAGGKKKKKKKKEMEKKIGNLQLRENEWNERCIGCVKRIARSILDSVGDNKISILMESYSWLALYRWSHHIQLLKVVLGSFPFVLGCNILRDVLCRPVCLRKIMKLQNRFISI